MVVILRSGDQEWDPLAHSTLNDRVDPPVYAPEDEWGLLLLCIVGPTSSR